MNNLAFETARSELGLFALCGSLLVGCGNTTSDEEEPSLPLSGRTFLSQEVTEGGVPRDLVANTLLRLRFHEDDRLTASAGCNTLDARYAVDGGALVVTGGGWTSMGCDPALHDQDTWYFDFLGTGPALDLEGDELELTGGAVAIRYLDEEVATPDRDLVGPTWTVDSLIEGEMISTPPVGAGPATLVFGDDGTLDVDSGCNAGSATWSMQGSTLSFASLSLTEMACDSPAMQLEQAVEAVVGSAEPVAWEIDVRRLDLRTATAGLSLVTE